MSSSDVRYSCLCYNDVVNVGGALCLSPPPTDDSLSAVTIEQASLERFHFRKLMNHSLSKCQEWLIVS